MLGIFRARLRGGAELEGTDLMRLDEDGKIREMTVFIRPLPGLAAFAAALGPRVARRRGRARGALLALMARPLAAVIRSGDGIGTRLARPAR
jgi:hypothetical protein